MVMTNAELIRKATGAVGTGDFVAASGLLTAEQADRFLDAAYDSVELLTAARKARRRSKNGTIAKIGVGRRVLRRKSAGVDDATLVKPTFGDVPYAVSRIRLDWEMEEEVFEENIEGEGLEDHIMRLWTDQVGRDLEDLAINGDTADTSVDSPFLTLDDGWLKQIAASAASHRVNGATINSGEISKDHFFAALEAMPTKFKTSGALRWVGSPTVIDRYADYLSDRATAAGDAVLFNATTNSPRGIGYLKVPAMPNDRLLLTDPRNLIVVTTRDMRRRKTTEGREAVRRDVRFYALFLDHDVIVEEMDAVVDIYGLDA